MPPSNSDNRKDQLAPNTASTLRNVEPKAPDRGSVPDSVDFANVEKDAFFNQFMGAARHDNTESSGQPAIHDALQKLQTAHSLPAARNKLPMQASTYSEKDSHISSAPLNKSVIIENSASQVWAAYLALPEYEKQWLSARTLNILNSKVIRAWCFEESEKNQLPNPSEVLFEFCRRGDSTSRIVLIREALWILLVTYCRQNIPNGQHGVRDDTELIGHAATAWDRILYQFGECYIRDGDGTVQRVSHCDDWGLYAASEQIRQMAQWETDSFKKRLWQFFPPELHPSLTQLDTAALMSWKIFDKPSWNEHTAPTTNGTPNVYQIHAFLGVLVSQCGPMGIPNATKLKNVLSARGVNAYQASQIAKYITDKGSHSSSTDIQHNVSFPATSKAVSVPADSPTSEEARPESAETIRAETEGDLPKSPKRATPDHESSQDDILKTQEVSDPVLISEQQRKVARSLPSRISRALENQSLSRLDQLWSEVQSTFESTSASRSDISQIRSRVYAQMLNAFMAMGRPNKAIDAWNHMAGSGVVPSVEHWDAMIKGCGMARNPSAVNDMWERMISSGIPPDAQLWATKIYALGLSGRIEAAIEAFKSMARLWLNQPAKKNGSRRGPIADTDSAPKPNAQCLNALVGILARANRHDQLMEVLSWRKPLNIGADTYTYNPLLKSALRDGNLELASRLIRQMQSHGVEPDIATFTMMLNASFRQEAQVADRLRNLPVVESTDTDEQDPLLVSRECGDSVPVRLPMGTLPQRSAVEMVFQQMAHQSIKPTAHTFSTLVSGLLRADPPNVSAAYGVLHYLSTHALPLSAQLYSSMIQYHFRQEPPELAAVDALWHHARDRRNATTPLILDSFFYDRCIEGWARAGQVQRAMQARKVAKAAGKLQDWSAIQALVESFARTGDWQSVIKVVGETKREEESAGADQSRSGRGKTAFWDKVKSLGIDSSNKLAADAAA